MREEWLEHWLRTQAKADWRSENRPKWKTMAELLALQQTTTDHGQALASCKPVAPVLGDQTFASGVYQSTDSIDK